MTKSEHTMNRRDVLSCSLVTTLALSLVPIAAKAADDELVGTYKLVSSQRKILDTGEVIDTYGKDPKGYITYGKDGRVLALITYDGRPKPESVDKTTDQQRSDLFRTMLAYGGTYKFDGNKIEHQIDISWNEVWSGTTVIRDIKKESSQLIYTTRPAPFSGDGKMSIVTLVWEKVK
jgi:hypothetical protein